MYLVRSRENFFALNEEVIPAGRKEQTNLASRLYWNKIFFFRIALKSMRPFFKKVPKNVKKARTLKTEKKRLTPSGLFP